MGREYRELRISGSVSRHNVPRDEEDDILWEQFVHLVKAVKNGKAWESLLLEVDREY